jgi:hypothetical protein
MYAHTMRSGVYYRCRSTGAEIGCGQGVREDRLLPWGRALMVRLEGTADPAAVHHAVEAELGHEAANVRPVDALAQIDANLERIGLRFEWGEFDADTYRAKRERLLLLRAEVEQSAARLGDPQLVLTGLVQAWDTEDAMTRRQLLWTLFDELDFVSGRIIAAQPRREVEAEVAAYLADWQNHDGLGLRLRFAEGREVPDADASRVVNLQ